MSLLQSSTMYKVVATIYGISAAGHMKLGFDIVYPALRKIPTVGNDKVGRRAAEGCWNYVGVSLFIAALLNWQWARTGGPQTPEENIIFWATNAMHVVNGFRYTQVGAYLPLFPLWLGPLVSLVAKNTS